MRYVLALVVLAVAAGSTLANGIGAYGSYWDPKDLDNAWGGGAKIQIEVVPSIYLEGRLGYFPEAEDNGDDGPKLDIVPVELAGVLKFPVDQFTPYLGAGAGYYLFDVKDVPTGIDVTVDDEIGYFGVAGAELSLGANVSLFGEAKYTWLDEVEIKAKAGGVTITDKSNLSGWGANVGLLLKW